MAEDDRNTDMLISNLSIEVKANKKRFEEINTKYMEVAADNDTLHQLYNEEFKKFESREQELIQRISSDHEKIKQLEVQKSELKIQVQLLEKREVVNEKARKTLLEAIEQIAIKNSLLQMGADESVKVAEDHKETEELHKKIILLEKQLDAKQAAEQEVERLNGQLNAIKEGEESLKWEKEQLYKKTVMLEKRLVARHAAEQELACLKSRLAGEQRMNKIKQSRIKELNKKLRKLES